MAALFKAFENYNDSTQAAWTVTIYIPDYTIRNCYFVHAIMSVKCGHIKSWNIMLVFN